MSCYTLFYCLLDLKCGECDVISLYCMCCSVDGSVCLVCCVLDSVSELFGETNRNMFWCGCYFLLLAPNDTPYKRWSYHNAYKLLCKLCRNLPPTVMWTRFNLIYYYFLMICLLCYFSFHEINQFHWSSDGEPAGQISGGPPVDRQRLAIRDTYA